MWKYFSRQIYTYSFHIFKLNDLKVIHDLYFQRLTQTLSKTTLFFLVGRKHTTVLFFLSCVQVCGVQEEEGRCPQQRHAPYRKKTKTTVFRKWLAQQQCCLVIIKKNNAASSLMTLSIRRRGYNSDSQICFFMSIIYSCSRA